MLLICVPTLLGRKRGDGGDGDASREEVAELRAETSLLKAGRSHEDASEVVNG